MPDALRRSLGGGSLIAGIAADLRPLFTRGMLLYAWLPALVVTGLHYRTPSELHAFHDVYRRLYYLPILFAAFAGGLRGGLALSVFVSAIYFPHAFASLAATDPAGPMEKGLELVLYNVVGVVAGILVDRERREKAGARRLADELSRSLAERKSMEETLIRAGKLGALGELTAGIAHEIKNPLHALKGTAEIVRDAIAPDAPERRMIDLHLEELTRLEHVADRFLSFAKPQAPDRRPTDLRDVVGRVASLVETSAKKAGVSVAVEPFEGAEPPVADADPDQLVQLLLNVAINGLQAMAPRGAGALSFALMRDEAEGGRGTVTVTVRNDGPPVPEESLARLFDPFFTTRDEGTGLGLSIAARIAEAHDARLTARNLTNNAGVEFALVMTTRSG